ncbi:MAG: hypothetical protein QOC68_1955 [Solirubrobacteraceae bacterium]|jgi:hypothetical protein|nr:hypothetical protein [Solirubrobacteraceae bacterium]
MTQTHAKPAVEPKPAEEPRVPVARGPAGVELLHRTIGNRAVGALLSRQRLARKFGDKPQAGQLISSDSGQIYEIIRSDFNKALGEWKYRVTGADGKAKTIEGWEPGYAFTSATQLIEAAAVSKTGNWRTVIDGIPEARLHELAGFHAWLDKMEPQLSSWRFAYLAAAIMVVSTHVPAARKEAMRLISAELGDKDVAMRMVKKPVQAVIVPRDKQMTELAEFKSLATDDSGGGPGNTFDGRPWAHVRGVGNVLVGSNVYAAITEENLLGGDPDPKVFEERKDGTGAVTVPAGAAQGGYTEGYSTTTHEFAHVLHGYGLSDDDKKVISKAYEARRTATSGSASKLTKKWVDGPRVSPTAPKTWKAAGWTDKKWLKHLNGLTDDARRVFECYASQSDYEYFAQLSNAYLGTNMGSDATTGQARRNGRAWIKANEPKEMLALLDRLYQNKTVNDLKSDGRLKLGGKCANPPKPPPGPPGAPPGGSP